MGDKTINKAVIVVSGIEKFGRISLINNEITSDSRKTFIINFIIITHIKYGNSPSRGVVDTTVVDNTKYLQCIQAEQLNKNILLPQHHDLLILFQFYYFWNYSRTSALFKTAGGVVEAIINLLGFFSWNSTHFTFTFTSTSRRK